MRRRCGRIAFACLLLAAPAAAVDPPLPMPPSPDAPAPDLFAGDEEEMPPDEPETPPAPSLREPFAIGEALYDPARVPDAVVSLLDLMGVPVVADLAAADRAPTLTLAEAEVRTLVEMGVADAQAASERDDGAFPYRFADVHAVVAPLLGEADLDALAAAYASAYAQRPDDLAPAVLMGQPVDSELTLGRVHVWLLLVDGFAAPGPRTAAAAGARAEGPRASFAVLRRGASGGAPTPIAGGARWGTAQAQIALERLAAKALDAVDLAWIAGHGPLLMSRVPLTISPPRASAHEGHGGPGPRVAFQAAIGAAAGPVVSPSGRQVLVPLARPNVAGRAIQWVVEGDDLDKFESHGSLQGTLNSWTTTDARGGLQLGYTPKRESANGTGSRQNETARLRAQMKSLDLLESRYEIAPRFQGLRGQLGGTTTVAAPVRLEWHSDGLRLVLTNTYDVALDFGALGKTHRWGYEGIRGTLEPQADGSFRGVVRAKTVSEHIGGGLGTVCAKALSIGSQWIEVRATAVTRLNENQDRSRFTATRGAMDGGYLSLHFKPVSNPKFLIRDKCQDADHLLRPIGGKTLLPFNDARWWEPGHTFVIAIPARGKLAYDDRSLADVRPDPNLGPFRAIIKGTFTALHVEVERADRP